MHSWVGTTDAWGSRFCIRWLPSSGLFVQTSWKERWHERAGLINIYANRTALTRLMMKIKAVVLSRAVSLSVFAVLLVILSNYSSNITNPDCWLMVRWVQAWEQQSSTEWPTITCLVANKKFSLWENVFLRNDCWLDLAWLILGSFWVHILTIMYIFGLIESLHLHAESMSESMAEPSRAK